MYSCALLDVEVGNCLEKTHLLPLARGALTHGEVDEIQIIAVPFRSKGRKLAAQNAKSARLSPAHILRLKGPPDSKTHKTPKCRRNAALGETRGAVGCLCTCPWIAQDAVRLRLCAQLRGVNECGVSWSGGCDQIRTCIDEVDIERY